MLFHLEVCPHHRTSVEKGLELISALSSCGEFSEEQNLNIVY